MDPPATILLAGVASRGVPGLRAVRAGRVTGLLAGRRRLPDAALRLPAPLAFATLPEAHAWLMAREPRLAAALRLLAGCREVGLSLRQDPAHGDDPARLARFAHFSLRIEAILTGAARAAVLPEAGSGERRWAIAVPEALLERLRRALESEARGIVGSGLHLHLHPPGHGTEIARAVLQDG